MKDIYENDISMQIVRANRLGDLGFLIKVFSSEKENILKTTQSELWNWLHRANLLRASPPEVIQFYVDRGVPVNAQDCYGNTPLYYAMREENVAATTILLNAGADPNIPNKDGNIPFNLMCGMPEELELCKLFISKGADIFFHTGENLSVIQFYRFMSEHNNRYHPMRNLLEVVLKQLDNQTKENSKPM